MFTGLCHRIVHPPSARSNSTLLAVLVILGTLTFAQFAYSNTPSFPFPLRGGVVDVDPKSGLEAADGAFAALGMSVPWTQSGLVLGSTQQGLHFAGAVQDRVLEIFNRLGPFRGLPLLDLAKCEVWIRTMNFGAPEITELVLELKRLGVGKIVLMAHGPAGFRLKDGLNRNGFRAQELQPGEGAMGVESNRLMRAGFKVNPSTSDTPYQLVVSEVPPRAGLQPLMHEKAVIVKLVKLEASPGFWGSALHAARQTIGLRRLEVRLFSENPYLQVLNLDDGPKLFGLYMTDNFTARPKPPDSGGRAGEPTTSVINRMMEVVFQLLLEQDLAHTKALATALRSTGKIASIPSELPGGIDERQAHRFRNGDILQMSYTNGRNMPNDRQIKMIQWFLEDPSRGRIVEVLENQYVISKDNWVEAIRTLMLSSPETVYTGLADSSFISTRGPGLVSVMAGFVGRGGSGLHDPFPESIRDRTNVFVYRRVAEDAESFGKLLLHDKVTVLRTVEGGVGFVYVFIGSLNKSDRYQNAEWQLFMKVREDSRTARFFLDSMRSLPKTYPKLFMKARLAVMASVLAQFIGVPPSKIFERDVERFLSELGSNNFGSIQYLARILRATSDASTIRTRDHQGRWVDEPKVSDAEVGRRLEVLSGFLSWYGERITTEDRGYADRGTLGDRAAALFRRAGARIADNFVSGRATMDPSQLAAIMDLIIDRSKPPRRRRGLEVDSSSADDLARARLLRAVPQARGESERVALAFELWDEIGKLLGLPSETERDFSEALRAEIAATDGRLGRIEGHTSPNGIRAGEALPSAPGEILAENVASAVAPVAARSRSRRARPHPASDSMTCSGVFRLAR